MAEKKPPADDFDADLATPAPEGFDDDLAAPTAEAAPEVAPAAAAEPVTTEEAVTYNPEMSGFEEGVRAITGPMGVADEVAAFVMSPLRGTSFEDERQRQEAKNRVAQTRHPGLALAGSVAPVAAATLAGGPLAGAAVGAVQGAGSGDSIAERLGQGALGGALGGLTIPAAKLGGKLTVGAISKVLRGAGGLLDEFNSLLPRSSQAASKASKSLFDFFKRTPDKNPFFNSKDTVIKNIHKYSDADGAWATGNTQWRPVTTQASRVARLSEAEREARTSAEKVLRAEMSSPKSGAAEHATQMSKNPEYRKAYRSSIDDAPSTGYGQKSNWTKKIE